MLSGGDGPFGSGEQRGRGGQPFESAVVTGAGSGIGRALAVHLAATGCRVVLADVDAAALDSVAREIGGTAVPTDVADPAAVRALAEAAGTVDLVCLNAGIVGPLGAPWEVDAAGWDRVFAVNTGGVVHGLRAFVPRLLAAGGPAAVLITASLAGLLSFSGNGAYGPSKRAVIAIAEQAALALTGTPVTVTVLCPALVRTGMSEIGEDSADVAAAAITATEAGRFAVVPPEWHTAVVAASQRLVTGQPPTPPTPAG